MSYQAIDDSGEFNDSVVYLHPLRLTEGRSGGLARHSNPQQVHLGIYDSIKLSSYLKSRQGRMIELVTVDSKSSNTFVNEDGEELLKQYATNEVAFVMVAGNQNVGKSFFCDKILNLCEIRGNHFCRNKQAGIYIWSTPFQKDNLKIFLLEISGCSIDSKAFKILLTYSIMIGSAFIIIDDLKEKQITALQEFDTVLDQIIGQMSTVNKEGGSIVEGRNIVLPQFFYFLKRRGEKKEQNLSVIANYIEEKLPDALAASYKGNQSELVHLPFLDVKCINEEYIRKTSHIFSELYEVITQKKYNDLTLTGSIILKVIKYVQNYINNSYKIRIQELYDRIIEDLYQSAYNYCILSYHEEMERHFEDEEPKSLDELLFIFQTASNNVLEKFHQFNLDDKFHSIFQRRLDSHIDEKELMILDINKLKTQRIIHESYQSSDINDLQTYNDTVRRIKKKYPNLDHGQSEGLGKLAYQLFSKTKNVDYKSLKEIERLNHSIREHKHILTDLKAKNDKKSKERGAVNKQQQELYQHEKRVQAKKKELKAQLEKAHSSMLQEEPDEMLKQREYYEEAIKRNNEIIRDLKKGEQKKSKEMVSKESKIEQTKRECTRLQKILEQMRNTKKENVEVKVEEKKQGKKDKKGGK